MTRRPRWPVALCALLVLLLGANWVGITVHIANLRRAAAQDRGAANSDAHVEYLAQASGFVSAQLFFGMRTLAAIVLLVIMVVRRSGYGRRRGRARA